VISSMLLRRLAATTAASVIALAPESSAVAQTGSEPEAREPAVFHETDSLTLRWYLQAGINGVAERDLFWNLAEISAPDSGFDPDTAWLEMYVKPGLGFEKQLRSGATLYGKLTAVSSYTVGTDAFDEGDIGATTLEEAHLGLRNEVEGGLSYDLSLGSRELKLGSGMLIASGASSGFERGALKLGPRKAWEMAASARLGFGGFSGTAFFLDPNELPSNDGRNRLAGLDFRYDNSNGAYLGGSWLRVTRSDSPYVQAAAGGVGAPTILPGAREDMQALNFYARAKIPKSLPNWTFTADLAYETSDRVDLRALAWRMQAEYIFAERAWTPTVSYGYQSFSGDDPNTARLERFDPLYYEGNPNAWSTGSKSSMAFINSNVNAHSIALRVQPSMRDTLTLRVARISANHLRSPIQFGQATRVEFAGSTANVVAGVTSSHLADDVFLEYNRVISRHLFFSAGVAVSVPGKGIRDVADGDAPDWTGGYLNLVMNY